MAHFQADRLREAMGRLFYLPEDAIDLGADDIQPHGEKTLRVFEPRSRVVVYTFCGVDFEEGRGGERGRLVRRANVQFDWPGDGERAVAEHLGLPASAWTTERRLKSVGPRPTTPGQKRVREFEMVRVPPKAHCPVADADRATDLCLAVLGEVFDVPGDRWLWIIDFPFDRDRWPDVIPSPEGWPGDVAWPTDFF